MGGHEYLDVVRGVTSVFLKFIGEFVICRDELGGFQYRHLVYM